MEQEISYVVYIYEKGHPQEFETVYGYPYNDAVKKALKLAEWKGIKNPEYDVKEI